MPIYEYRCDACGHQEEFLQKVSEPPLTECPACHKSSFKKLLSAAGFQLKGSGWYVTDFRNKPADKKTEKPAASTETKGAEAKGGEAKGAEAKGGEAKGDSSGEAKPAAKTKSEAPAT